MGVGGEEGRRWVYQQCELHVNNIVEAHCYIVTNGE